MTFNNPNYKLPNPMFKYKLSFKISKLANPKLIEYQFENELVFVPLIEKTNLLYFQTLIDRNIIQKEKIQSKCYYIQPLNQLDYKLLTEKIRIILY